MSNSYMIHGNLHDVIDYKKYIEMAANTPTSVQPLAVKHSKVKYKKVKKVINKKGHSLGMLRK